MKMMADRGFSYVRKVRGLDPNLDPEKLRKKMVEWLYYKKVWRKYNLHEWDDAIDWISVVDPKIDSKN